MSYVTFTKAGINNRVVALNADMVLSVETSTANNANSMINSNPNLIVVGNVTVVSAALNQAISIKECMPLSFLSS